MLWSINDINNPSPKAKLFILKSYADDYITNNITIINNNI